MSSKTYEPADKLKDVSISISELANASFYVAPQNKGYKIKFTEIILPSFTEEDTNVLASYLQNAITYIIEKRISVELKKITRHRDNIVISFSTKAKHQPEG